MDVLVYGFYGKNNFGDELFEHSFKKLFPEINFIFTDFINKELLNRVSAVFIGGGSFLFSPVETDCFDKLKEKPIFYIGVGAETEIHRSHIDLIKLAKFVGIRSDEKFDIIKNLNINTIIIPDIVYCLGPEMSVLKKKNNSVLVLPNILTVPDNSEAHWKHNSWEHFKFEFSQFLDVLVDKKYDIKFLSLSNSNTANDNFASYEIIGAMKNRNSDMILNINLTYENMFSVIEKYSFVLTQRYHGMVLAEIYGLPYITIAHHDKLKKSLLNSGSFLSFYEISKQKLLDTFYLELKKEQTKNVALECNIFVELKSKINNILGSILCQNISV